ncbi:hypothetical protein GCM10009641_87900 [Mycobacterium cookii]|uniref:Uncharacterized protein n=1 Tax=Nocardioides furvisabuli TaxID=375542 RepID=A0ABP5I3Z2_9ACTN|nr:DUF6527 family protein [Nocardioides furvisabuli]
MTVEALTPEFVDSFPRMLEPGKLYVSIEFTTCAHLCACGCGEEVITPLSPAQWSFTFNGCDVSMRPSIGNWTLPCQSHYIIQRGQIRWSYQFTKDEIAANRARDRRALEGRDVPISDLAVLPDAAPRKPGSQRFNHLWERIWDLIRG